MLLKCFSSEILKEEKVNNFLPAGYKTITEFFYCFLSSLLVYHRIKDLNRNGLQIRHIWTLLYGKYL